MNESLEKLPTKHKVLLFLLASLMTVAVFFAIVLAPQQARVAALQSQLVAQQQQVQTLESYALAHPDAGKYAEELNQRIAQVNHLLPGQADISGFLIQLEQLAKASNVKIAQLQPSPPVNKKGFYEVPVAMAVKGTYFQLLDFIQRLEGAERFSSISTMTLQAGKDSSLEGKVTVHIYAFGQATVPTPQQSPPQSGGAK